MPSNISPNKLITFQDPSSSGSVYFPL